MGLWKATGPTSMPSQCFIATQDLISLEMTGTRTNSSYDLIIITSGRGCVCPSYHCIDISPAIVKPRKIEIFESWELLEGIRNNYSMNDDQIFAPYELPWYLLISLYIFNCWKGWSALLYGMKLTPSISTHGRRPCQQSAKTMASRHHRQPHQLQLQVLPISQQRER